jgi:DNA-binding response OmpR family regulator
MAHRILIVDDDQIFNNLLADVFRQAGYDVSCAFSAAQAREILAGGG